MYDYITSLGVFQVDVIDVLDEMSFFLVFLNFYLRREMQRSPDEWLDKRQ